MSIKLNIIRGWATTIIGLITTIVSLILVYKGVFDFVWEGVAGLAIGALLITAPQTIEKKISSIISGWRGTSKESPPNQ